MATVTEVRAADSSLARYRFVSTIFLGSFLLFLVQPMIARMVLPRLGGAPAVWNSAMLVYQALLLAGYAYAHWLGRFSARRQGTIHLAAFALAAVTLPIGLVSATPSASANPFFWVPAILVLSIGPLFFVVSAQAPLIQRWYALSDAGDPYPLYAASNLGSFAGLLAYPLLVEPFMPVSQQRWLWTGGYCALALLVAWCALNLPRTEAPEERRHAAALPLGLLGKWVLLAAVPSGLILSTTLHLTTDLVAMPLLWVIPLGVYLLSFTVAFASARSPARAISRLAPFVLIPGAAALIPGVADFTRVFAALALINLFTVSVALHSRLFDTRPAPSQLTSFYLAMSVGGVLGGIFCALVAPQIFDWTYEHLILLVAAAALMAGRHPVARLAAFWDRSDHARRVTAFGVLLVTCLAVIVLGPFGLPRSSLIDKLSLGALIAIAVLAVGNRLLFVAALGGLMLVTGGWERIALSAAPGKMTRSFFGIYTVNDSTDFRRLVHGTTTHGVENLGSTERERMPTTYYVPGSGVGEALQAAPKLFGDHARIDVVGLGAGTLACYAQPGQSWTIYEIDPAIVHLARDSGQFHFLSRCLPNARIKVGDARLTLDRSPANSADILVVDAFSSDSIPMHLMTREAFDIYGRRLAPEGLLLVHISNRYLSLEPVVAAAARDGGWKARMVVYDPSAAELEANATRSAWIALSRSPASLGRLVTSGSDWQPLRQRSNFSSWTDDHASVLPLIRWQGL